MSDQQAKFTKMPPKDVAPIKSQNNVLARVAYKLGEEYGLKGPSDFRIKFHDFKRHAFRCRKFGSAVGVYFNVAFTHPEFEFYLRQALLAVAAELEDRPLPELASRLREREEEHEKANKWVASMPKLVSRNECLVTEIFAVEVQHRATGLVVRKESTNWHKIARLIYDAREELTEKIAAVNQLQEEMKEALVKQDFEKAAEIRDEREELKQP